MVSKYDITDVSMYSEGTHMKNVSLKSGRGKKIDAISKSIERTTDLKTLSDFGTYAINECYIDLTLDKLREIDGDKDLQERYILNRAKFLEKGYTNIFIVKLRTDSRLDELDYEYLTSLLGWTMNDIYVMPTLEFENVSGAERYEIYDEFVTKMLDMKGRMIKISDLNVGVMIPSFYSRRRIANLFGLYEDVEHNFVAVDFNNQRIDSKPSGVTSTVRKYFDDKKEEKTFFYGVNVKPWPKATGLAGDPTDALDVHSIHLSFNATGPTHSNPRRIILSPGWDSLGRAFDPDDYSYHKMSDERIKSVYIDWMESNYRIELSPIFEENATKPSYAYVKRMNFQRANEELAHLSGAIRNSDSDALRNVISRMPEKMRRAI